LHHPHRFDRFVINVNGPGPGFLCPDLFPVPRILFHDTNEVLDKVVPKAGVQHTAIREPDTDLPSDHDHHPGHHDRRPNDFQDNQDSLLPRSESTQVDGRQTCPGGCADANEEGIDEFDMKFAIGCPEDDGPEERYQDTEGQQRAIRTKGPSKW
jgi:hypothetical protein